MPAVRGALSLSLMSAGNIPGWHRTSDLPIISWALCHWATGICANRGLNPASNYWEGMKAIASNASNYVCYHSAPVPAGNLVVVWLRVLCRCRPVFRTEQQASKHRLLLIQIFTHYHCVLTCLMAAVGIEPTHPMGSVLQTDTALHLWRTAVTIG